MVTPLKVLIENFAKYESFEAIDALPTSHASIKELLRAAQNGNEKLIQPLYTKICESTVPEISALTLHPYTLLSTLLAVSIAHEKISVITRLLTITPSPRPDLRRFLNQPGTPFSTKITSTQNPEIRSLMLKYGYQKSDRHGVAFDQGLYDVILGKEENYLDIVSTMLENGAQPKMDHLRAAMKLKPISVFELLLKHYPSEELKDCRLLHDAIEGGKAGRVRYLIDVVGINIDLFPTERPEQESEFPNPYGTRTSEPNGTPLHEAVRHNRKTILEILLEKGARTDIKDEDGQTPYEVAKKRKAKDIMAWFPEHAKRAATFSDLRGFFRSGGRQ